VGGACSGAVEVERRSGRRRRRPAHTQAVESGGSTQWMTVWLSAVDNGGVVPHPWSSMMVAAQEVEGGNDGPTMVAQANGGWWLGEI
jgi:hypothetical protein